MFLAISGNNFDVHEISLGAKFKKHNIIFADINIGIIFTFYRSKLVCEDSDDLLSRAARENPGVTIPEPVAIKN